MKPVTKNQSERGMTMSENKFRAWDEHENKMIDNFLLYSYGGDASTYQGIETIELIKRISPDKIIQYTGTKDKKDVEVYAKDIIQWDDGDIGVVEFDKEELAWHVTNIKGEDDSWLCGVNERGTVIGNALKNPELLNNSNKKESKKA